MGNFKQKVKDFCLNKDTNAGPRGPSGPMAEIERLKEEETPQEKRARMTSIWLLHIQMLIYSLSFSIVFTGVFPYLKQLLPSETEEDILSKYGWVVALNPLGQMIASPIMGYFTNRLNGSVRPIGIVSSIIFIIANILYALPSLAPEGNGRYAILLMARFFSGVSTGNVAAFRTYIVEATYMSERTTHLAISAAFQGLGMTIGPGIQAALAPLACADPNDTKGHQYIAFDMFTMAGWVSAVTGFLSLILFIPVIFKEYNVIRRGKAILAERLAQKKKTEGEGSSSTAAVTQPTPLKPDYVTAWICILMFYMYFVNFVVMETVGTPICMDQFGWNDKDVVTKFGAIMTSLGILSFFCFTSIGPLSKKFDERFLLLTLGLATAIIGRVALFPIPGYPIPPKAHNSTLTLSSMVRSSIIVADNVDCQSSAESQGGCALEWCTYMPALTVAQFVIGALILTAGHPYRIALTQSIYSKMLGPIPQGTWMGLLSASGSLARVTGPLFVSSIYDNYGTYLVMLIPWLGIIVVMVLMLWKYKAMIPYQRKLAMMLEGSVAVHMSSKQTQETSGNPEAASGAPPRYEDSE